MENNISLEQYKAIRIKYAQQINDCVFNPNEFIGDMRPFWDERKRKYLAYTSEVNEIDNRLKPDTDLLKVDNKIHAGLYSVVVDQAVNHFVGIPVKWDYDVTTKKQNKLQEMAQKIKNKFFENVIHSQSANEFEKFQEIMQYLRFEILDPDSATYQGATGCAFRLLEPVETKNGWELRASNIEPWMAEKYENGAVFIRIKYDTRKRQFYQELTLITEEEITVYKSYSSDNSISTGDFNAGESKPNPLGAIYLAEFKNNTNRYCDFDVAEEIADAVDRSLSDEQNEIEQFKLAYMFITGVDLDLETAKQMMSQLGIINIPESNGKAEYITKQLNKDFNEYHINLMVKQFYTVCKAIDFNDEVFKSNSSGEARKWQIIALEAKTNTKEQYFTAGLKECAKVIAAFLSKMEKTEIDYKKIIFTFSRSLPTDIGYLADALPKLAPYISRRTLQSQIPFVDDVDYENEMIDIENIANSGSDYGFPLNNPQERDQNGDE